MDILSWAKLLLESPELSVKLTDIKPTAALGQWSPYGLPESPARAGKIQFSSERIKFPGLNKIKTPEGRSIAVHSFANHELLAIEMMAAALLIYPHDLEDPASVRLKKGLVSTIRDEQKHLKLYISRLKDDGVEFGDYPLNDFFWRQMPKLTSMDSFLALMSMTFESANLDFALQYQQVFREAGDTKTAEILKVVYEDELTHVAFGAHWINQWKQDKTLWEYYTSILPYPLTPARAKGPVFSEQSRVEAGLDPDWINHLRNYHDDYRITTRRAWK